jgi:hypothetical protein
LKISPAETFPDNSKEFSQKEIFNDNDFKYETQLQRSTFSKEIDLD